MKKILAVATTSFVLLLAACKDCPTCPVCPTPDLSSPVDLSPPPDMAFDTCRDRPCTADGDCVSAYCKCSMPGGGKCVMSRCTYPPCVRH